MFTFLPTDLQHDEKVTIAHGEDKETVSVSVPSAAEDGSEPSGERKKLLIVEDNADFRAYLVHEFSSDFDVVEAGTVSKERKWGVRNGPTSSFQT